MEIMPGEQELVHRKIRFDDGSGSSIEGDKESEESGSPRFDGLPLQELPKDQQQVGPQLKLLPMNDQIRELQTIIRDR
ncbi:hypothetical protein XELAEV_18042045mg [Xenopus laevis]|nr:hypothetical protein XELAEV_18042045mg [Xenopus laevis]